MKKTIDNENKLVPRSMRPRRRIGSVKRCLQAKRSIGDTSYHMSTSVGKLCSNTVFRYQLFSTNLFHRNATRQPIGGSSSCRLSRYSIKLSSGNIVSIRSIVLHCACLYQAALAIICCCPCRKIRPRKGNDVCPSVVRHYYVKMRYLFLVITIQTCL